ncbi:MAG: Hpt domain-containing protein [Silvanigrellaceae bacterium]
MNQVSKQQPSELPVIDVQQLEVLEELSDENESIVDELTRMFRSTVPGLLADLSSAITASDRDSVRRISHRLKGSAANIGAKRMAEECSLLEQRAKTNCGIIEVDCFAAIQGHYAESELALVSWLKNRS